MLAPSLNKNGSLQDLIHRQRPTTCWRVGVTTPTHTLLHLVRTKKFASSPGSTIVSPLSNLGQHVPPAGCPANKANCMASNGVLFETTGSSLCQSQQPCLGCQSKWMRLQRDFRLAIEVFLPKPCNDLQVLGYHLVSCNIGMKAVSQNGIMLRRRT